MGIEIGAKAGRGLSTPHLPSRQMAIFILPGLICKRRSSREVRAPVGPALRGMQDAVGIDQPQTGKCWSFVGAP